MSQKQYVWNRGNPAQYSDPTGFDSALLVDANPQSGGAIQDAPDLGQDDTGQVAYQQEPHALQYAVEDGVAFALMSWAHAHNGNNPSGSDAEDFLEFAIGFIASQIEQRKLPDTTLNVVAGSNGPLLEASQAGSVVAKVYVDRTAHNRRMFGGVEVSARIFGAKEGVWSQKIRFEYSRMQDDIYYRYKLEDFPRVYPWHLFPGDELNREST